MLKIVTIIGARPQFVKSAAVSRAIEKRNTTLSSNEKLNEIIVHTGQHYDDNMDRIFFDELKIPKPDYNLSVGSGTHGYQTGQMLVEIEKIITKEKPDLVITYGDTNSTLAGALSASKLHVLSAHVEAGLRSFNRKMPEEINRIVADGVSNLLFCPTDTAANNLFAEGLKACKGNRVERFSFNSQSVYQVGDVMYDSVLFYRQIAEKKSDIHERLDLSPKKYCLATIHRAENTDNKRKLQDIISTLSRIASKDERIIVPVHPRTQAMLKEIDSEAQNERNLEFIAPVGYLSMIALEKNAKMIFTDSGGVQKEAYFFSIPCITLRDETEWVETVREGWNCLTGTDQEKIFFAYSEALNRAGKKPPFKSLSDISNVVDNKEPSNIYGDGHAAEKIVDIILNQFVKSF